MPGASFFQEQGDLKNKHRALPLLLVAVRGPREGLEAESNLPRGPLAHPEANTLRI